MVILTEKHAKHFAIVLMFVFINNSFFGKTEPPLYSQYVNEIVDNFTRDMQNKYDLIFVGSGGRMPHNVEQIMVSFVLSKRTSIEAARKLEVMAAEGLLQQINSHEKIKCSLAEIPFKSNRISISIGFNDSNGEEYSDGSVVHSLLCKDKITYYVNDPSKNLHVEIFEESYEEAIKRCRNSKK